MLQEASASLGMKRSDLALFRFNPLAGPSSSMISRDWCRASGEPHSVPSSRYLALVLTFPVGPFRDGVKCQGKQEGAQGIILLDTTSTDDNTISEEEMTLGTVIALNPSQQSWYVGPNLTERMAVINTVESSSEIC